MAHILQVQQTAVSINYLGAPIATNSQAYDFLLDKFQARLQAWKGKLLSHAGRVTLIKSVLQAIPIYFMATSKIPKRVLKKLTALIRQFSWGKMEKERYMSLISWEKIVALIEMGGLGLRDLWDSKRTYMCTVFWRGMMQLREELGPLLTWNLGDGTNCTVFA